MNPRLPILLVVFAAFSLYSAMVVLGHGYTGFLELARREPWGMQMLIDLVISLTLFLTWASRDARARRIPLWPFAVATILLGSIGALAYLVVREIKGVTRSAG